MPHTFYRPRVPWLQSTKYLKLVEQFVWNWLYVFSTPPEKAKNDNNIWRKDQFVLFPYTGLKIHWNFATTIFSRLRDPLIEIFTIKNSWPWKCRSRSWCTTFPVPPFDGKYMTFHLMAVVIFFSSFHRLRNICDARKKAKTLVLKMNVNVKE